MAAVINPEVYPRISCGILEICNMRGALWCCHEPGPYTYMLLWQLWCTIWEINPRFRAALCGKQLLCMSQELCSWIIYDITGALEEQLFVCCSCLDWQNVLDLWDMPGSLVFITKEKRWLLFGRYLLLETLLLFGKLPSKCSSAGDDNCLEPTVCHFNLISIIRGIIGSWCINPCANSPVV